MPGNESTETGGLSKRDAVTGWILALLFLVIYLLSPSVHNNHDAVGWAEYLDEYASAEGNILWPTETPGLRERHQELTPEELAAFGAREKQAGWWVLWNPHHLLYLPVTAVLFRLVHQVIPVLGGMTFLQWWNSLAGVIVLLLLHRLLCRIIPGSPYILPWCLFLATSVTFFQYAVDGAQYLTPVVFLALAAGGMWAWASDPKPIWLIKIGLWLALAVLFHQIVSIIVPFFVIAAWLRIRELNGKEKKISGWWSWSPLLVGMGLPVIVYLVTGAIALVPTGEFTFDEILKYVTLYGRKKEYWEGSIFRGIQVNLVTYIGFFFGNPRTQGGLFIHIPYTILVMIVPALWLITGLRVKYFDPLKKWWSTFCGLWILPLLIFLCFWVPGNEFYHLFLAIPLSFLAIMGAENIRRPGSIGFRDVVLFWLWCLTAIVVNLPVTLSGCKWLVGE